MHPTASDRSLPAVLLALTASTGLIDAVSYLALGHVFTANMTGNVVFLGFAVAGAPGLSIPRSAAAVGAFLTGAWRTAGAGDGSAPSLGKRSVRYRSRASPGRGGDRTLQCASNAQAISAACLSRCSAPCARIRQRGPPAGRKSRAGLAHPVQETGP